MAETIIRAAGEGSGDGDFDGCDGLNARLKRLDDAGSGGDADAAGESDATSDDGRSGSTSDAYSTPVVQERDFPSREHAADYGDDYDDAAADAVAVAGATTKTLHFSDVEDYDTDADTFDLTTLALDDERSLPGMVAIKDPPDSGRQSPPADGSSIMAYVSRAAMDAAAGICTAGISDACYVDGAGPTTGGEGGECAGAMGDDTHPKCAVTEDYRKKDDEDESMGTRTTVNSCGEEDEGLLSEATTTTIDDGDADLNRVDDSDKQRHRDMSLVRAARAKAARDELAARLADDREARERKERLAQRRKAEEGRAAALLEEARRKQEEEERAKVEQRRREEAESDRIGQAQALLLEAEAQGYNERLMAESEGGKYISAIARQAYEQRERAITSQEGYKAEVERWSDEEARLRAEVERLDKLLGKHTVLPPEDSENDTEEGSALAFPFCLVEKSKGKAEHEKGGTELDGIRAKSSSSTETKKNSSSRVAL